MRQILDIPLVGDVIAGVLAVGLLIVAADYFWRAYLEVAEERREDGEEADSE